MTQEASKEDVPEVVEADLDTMTATKETLEDYTLRFAPRSYRKWSTRVVGISALGGIAYLADFAIGANIGISYGTTNALWGILIFAVVVMATGFPVAYYSARYNIDLDLVTRGSGFGYYGSGVTNLLFATFPLIFFRLRSDRVSGGVLLRPVQHRPRPGHPRQRLRVLRLGRHQRHLRDVHLHLLRARRLDNGPGPQARPRHTAMARVCGLDPDHLPAGDLRH